MTTTMSYSKESISKHLYKTALKKLMGMGIFYSVVSFILFPLQYILQIPKSQVVGVYSFPYFHGVPEIYTMVTVVFYIAFLLLYGIIMNISLNSYIHNRRAVDTYHALPVERHMLLRANLLATITWMIVPLFVCFGIVSMANFAVQSASFSAIWLEFFKLVCIVLAIQAITTFSGIMLNGAANTVLGTFILNFVTVSLLGVILIMFTGFLRGYNPETEAVILEYGIWFSPMMLAYTSLFETNLTEYYNVAIAWGAASVLILILCEKLYKMRPSEQAQSNNTRIPLYRLIVIITTFIGALGFSMIVVAMMNVYEGEATFNTLTIGMTFAGAVISYVAAKAIYSHSFKLHKSDLKFGALCISAPMIFLAAVMTGGLGFESRIPEISDVAHVSIDYNGEYSLVNALEENYMGGYYYRSYNEPTILASDEGKALIVEMHQNIIDEYNLPEEEQQNNHRNSIIINYTLQNGSTMTRQYRGFSDEVALSAFNIINDMPEFLNQNSPILKETSEEVDSFGIVGALSTELVLLNLNEEEKAKLYEAIGKDTLAVSMEDKLAERGGYLATINVYYKEEYQQYDDVQGYNSINDAYAKYQNVLYHVNSHSYNTIAVLEDLGYGDMLKPDYSNIYEVSLLYAPYDYYSFGRYSDYPYIMAEGFEFAMEYGMDTEEFIQYNFGDNFYVKTVEDENEVAHLLENLTTYRAEGGEVLVVLIRTNDTIDATDTIVYFIERDDLPYELAAWVEERAAVAEDMR